MRVSPHGHVGLDHHVTGGANPPPGLAMSTWSSLPSSVLSKVTTSSRPSPLKSPRPVLGTRSLKLVTGGGLGGLRGVMVAASKTRDRTAAQLSSATPAFPQPVPH